MMTIEDWTYCQINFQILDDGRGFLESGLANRQMWIRFIAQSENKTIQSSEKLPIHTGSSTILAPQKGNISQEQVLEELVESLKHDGWQVVDSGGTEWWQVRLRKIVPFEKPDKPKLSTRDRITIGVLALTISILGIVGFNRFSNLSPARHYLNVTNAELQTAPENSGPEVEQMLIINLDRREVDPLQGSLPAELAAADQSQAQTVVWLDCDTESNWRGAKTDCAITVIDWLQQQILDEQLIEGEFTLHPEDADSQALPAEYRNDQAILVYLTSLPRK